MRQVVPKVTCDRCGTDIDPTTRSTVVTVELPGGAPQAFAGENCPDCSEHLHADLFGLLDSFLRKEAKPGRPPRPRTEPNDEQSVEDRTCPLCGRLKVSRGALAYHLKADHDTTLTELGLAKPGKPRAGKRASAGSAAPAAPPAPAAPTRASGPGLAPLPRGMTRAEAEELIARNMCLYDDAHGPYRDRTATGTHLRVHHGVSLTQLGLSLPSGAPAHKRRRAPQAGA